MEAKGNMQIMRVFTSSTDKFRHTPIYELVVYAARRYGIAGATVFRGIMGYGSSSQISTQRFWEVSEKMPVVVEIIDETEKVETFFETIKPYLDVVPKGCVVTMEPVRVVFSKSGTK